MIINNLKAAEFIIIHLLIDSFLGDNWLYLLHFKHIANSNIIDMISGFKCKKSIYYQGKSSRNYFIK